MTRATLSPRKKHVYFYTVLALSTLALASLKTSPSDKAAVKTRASEANKLANTLFL